MNLSDELSGLVVACQLLKPFGAELHFNARAESQLANLPLDALRTLVLQHRLVVLRGLPAISTKEEFSAACTRFGPLLEWNFGTVFEVVEHSDPKNYLFTSGSVPYHWDGAFASTAPWLQMFQCREAPGGAVGGETIFCDTVALWASLAAETKQLWRQVEIDYATEKVAHYGGLVRAKLIQEHPLSGETVIRFAEPANATTAQINTPQLAVHGIEAANAPKFLQELIMRLYDEQFVYTHLWKQGDFLIADNHALLHGRHCYDSQLPRRLWRVHVLGKAENAE